ncbi:alkaline phosphatase D family protein [Variovorax saccharolyticus]|uniref:alkaline phosphatase D family protein n=1 Tax=Variovorax saccharolyticus TaxID=3053516 RepID=UPI002576C11A|nr:alkaline phosphatase D family protein [Variovorax sp. J31P216]MDM0029516.1 alkaline phosphatase D family protein [Variovorax sp. J31P216]
MQKANGPDATPREHSTSAAEPSRRSFVRGAILYAMCVGSGVSVVGCGGGGGGGGGGVGVGGAVGGAPPQSSATTLFAHGVGSGDPLADRVILWTRVTTPSPGVLNLTWEVASDENMGAVVARGTTSTGPEQDHTVKVDATGLQAASVYYYRFYVGAEASPVGRTRTLPVGNVSQVRLGVVSCSNFPAGYFNVCAELSKRTDVDVVLHLGDYIYEYGALGYAAQLAFAIDRESKPSREILTLAEYRERHAQNRADPDLMAMHAKMPVIAVWDDHDVADNAWSGGAQNHDSETEGSFAARRLAAMQAYREWLPIRTPDLSDPQKIYRSFDFGTLASLHMLDTRLIGRDEQVSLDSYLAGGAASASRQLLGSEQTSWLTGRLKTSRATWQVLGQQVLMARMEIPQSIASAFTPETLGEFLLAQSTPEPLRNDTQRALLAQRHVPYNLDAWDGYPAARETVLAAARSLGRNLVSLAGDTHNAWASNLTDDSGQRVGVEFATASISSPGFERLLPLISNTILSDAFPKMVKDLRYAETSNRGYLVVTLTPAEVRGDWMEVSTVFSRSYTARIAMSLRALPGVGNLEVSPA